MSLRSHGSVDRVGVLCRADDPELQRVVRLVPGVEVVVPQEEPAEMRASVQALVDAMLTTEPTGWMLIPADHPVLELGVLDRMIQAWERSPKQIAVPVHAGRRGHPTIFPASFPSDLMHIPLGKGINWLLHTAPAQGIQEVECAEPSVLFDLDTPEDLARLQEMKPPGDRQSSGNHPAVN